MRRSLVVVLVMATAAAVAIPAASGATKKPLKVTTRGWYVFDGVDPVGTTAKNGTYRRCTHDPQTPPVNALAARYAVKNRPAPKGRKHILNGPDAIHIAASSTKASKPGKYFARFRASRIGRSSFPPGKYTYKQKIGSKTLAKETITLVDDTSC